MAAKYKQYFEKMVEENKEQFENFKDIHDNYVLEPEKWQKIYNEYGKEVLEMVQEWENKLCKDMESGPYAKYSTNLSEKFREEVKKYFPKINSIGLHPQN